jgi:hypothetical protein
MVGVVHECVAREFACMFEEKLLFRGVFKSIRMVGSTRFGGPSLKSKEVDVSYKPCFCDLTNHCPSFVIEVGASEYVLCCMQMSFIGSPTVMGKLA